MTGVVVFWRALACLAFALVGVAATPALAVDLQVSQYSLNPDPVPRGGTTTFSIRLTNNGVATVTDATLLISVAPYFRVEPAEAPAGCALSGGAGAQLLTCALALPAGNSTVTYLAHADTIGSSNTTARISSPTAADPNPTNDTLTITPAVISGADLSLAKTDGLAPAHSISGGGTINYVVTVSNAGPDATNAIVLTDQLPATADFQFASASGAGWDCGNAGTTVTCTYNGAALVGAYAPVTITGQVVRATTGSIINNASVALSSALVGDKNLDNNKVDPGVQTTITAGTDLQALKTMPATIFVDATVAASTVTIGANNTGPQPVSDATVIDAIPANLTIDGATALPSGCTVAAPQTVTCHTGALASGAQKTFDIKVRGATPGVGLTNTATVTPPAGVIDPNSGNDSQSRTFQVQAPGADLMLSKVKTNASGTADPIGPNQDMISTIRVTNNGPSTLTFSAANPLKVTDQLGAHEIYKSAGPGWSCSAAGSLVTCLRAYTGTISPNSSVSLVLTTTSDATADGTISNTACTGTTAGSPATPADPLASNDCAVGSITASAISADLAIDKTVSLTPGGGYVSSLDVPGQSNFYIKLVASNNGPGPAAGVTVSDQVAGVYKFTGNSTVFTVVDGGGNPIAPGNVTIAADGTVTWTIGALASGAGNAQTLIIRAARPFQTGTTLAAQVNTATIKSSDTYDPILTNNTSSASYTLHPSADVTVTQKSVTPTSTQTGVSAIYTISTKNIGPNFAEGVVVEDVIDTTKFDLIGDPTTTKPDGTCSLIPGSGTATVHCDLGIYQTNNSYQVVQTVRPRYPFGGATTFPQTNTNTATITSTSYDPVSSNNSKSVSHTVTGPVFDLSITKQEPGPEYDPIAYGLDLTYDIRLSNFGPSRANNIVMIDTPAPPAGYTMTFNGFTVNDVAATSGLSLYTPPAPNCVAVGATVQCKLDSTNAANNFLDPLRQTVFRVRFTPGGVAPTGPLTFTDSATITATEQPTTTVSVADNQLANNTATQTTTVLPSADLEVVSKTRVTPSPAAPGAPIQYRIVIANNGASATTQVRVTDQLPAGFVLSTPVPTVQASGATIVSSISCSGTNTVLCVLNGNFPSDPGHGSTAAITLTVTAATPYSGPTSTDVTNIATIAPGQDSGGNPLTGDGNAGNNSKTATVQIASAAANSSIAGIVFADGNGDNAVEAGEGLAGATVTLQKSDGTVVATQVTGADGSFAFAGLLADTYQLVETQPGGYFDGRETAGTSAGTVNNAAFGSTAATNSITTIVLPASTAATGYLFQELAAATVSGTIYHDLNNNGAIDAGEPGFAPAAFASSPQLRLTGTDYAGTAVNLTTPVDANGAYSFTNLAPSDATGYTVTELVQPTGATDGLDRNGVGNVIAGSAGRTAPEDIAIGKVAPGATLPNRDFGEILSGTLSGSIFLDPNGNATREAGETTGLLGGVVRLTGTATGGAAVDCSITTAADGTFSFPNAGDPNAACRVLNAGTYTLTETPPAGYTHVGVFIGTAGGTAGGASGANTPAVGAGNLAVGNIVVAAGTAATRYDFAEKGQGMLSGSVYVDRNGNGTRDTGETGIAGVSVALSGTAGTGQDVCSLASCTATTDAAGNFSFNNLPGSNAAGYTLTEQAQSGAPLSSYGDGTDAAGTIGGTAHGTAANDVITGIVLAGGDLGTDYRFGELAGSLAGHTFVDFNNDGVFQTGETSLAGITVTLSGTTSAGQAICPQRTALSPALACTATTAADGSYSFGDLPAGSYTLVEDQPSAYSDGKEGAGSPAGTVVNTAFGATAATNSVASIALGAGVVGTGYDFGELGVTVSGRVFKDPQRDGVDSGGEPGIAGVTVRLLQGSTVIATTTTAADGSYKFTGIAAGTYTVDETQPAGYGSSSPNTVTVNPTAGVTQAVNFAETISTIAGSVFVDTNNDGHRQSGEAGIAAATVTLAGTDAAGGAVSRTAATDANGNFSFGDLLAGTYTLTETQPTGFGDGLDSAGTMGGTVGNDVISAIALPAGTDATAYAFGEAGVAVSGTVYLDTNLNGHQDDGEPGIGAVTITLRTGAGAVVATTTTGADGTYSFAGVAAGSYTIVETQPAGYGDSVENGSNSASVTVGTTSPPAVNFGERAGSLAGLVYNDSNQNGRHDSTEPPIAGVTVTLTGTDANGLAVSLTTVSAADGSFKFTGLVGGTYALSETQPADFQDGIDSPGTSGGTAAAVGADLISGIILGPAQDATGYLFGEHGASAQLSGSVWFDANHNGVRDPNEPGKPGWTVQLFQSGVLVGTTTTDANGAYQFVDLLPGSGYSILFRDPSSQAAFGSARPNETGLPAADGVISTANPAGASFSTGQLMGLTLAPGANVAQQSLPLDPSGVVYDSIQRTVVPGATVKLTGPAGFDPATQLLGGTINASQTVGSDGIYQFLLLPGAPNGVYTLSVTPPAGGSYNTITPSTFIPPCSGPLTVGRTPAPLLISIYDGAPPTTAVASCAPGSASTGYYLSFNLTAGISADVVNNNIPIDPIIKGAIIVTKTTPMTNVTRGGLVPYQITARNSVAGGVPNIAITDRVPAGFRYRTGSAQLNGVAITPIENGRLLTFPAQNFAASESKRIDLILTVGAGVGDGEHVNQAYAVNAGSGTVVSNLAEATVKIEADADFDCSDVLGKVFDDRNGNGYEDPGEPGLPGVRVVTVAGDLITTDADGRYHVTCPQIPDADRGSNFILKLDTRTLPTGYRMTTENPDTVRLTSGKFVKLNFGAALMRVIRLDVRDTVFADDKVAPDYVEKTDALILSLQDKPSVLRIVYTPHGEDQKLIRKRIAALKSLIEHKWADIRRRCRLIVEVEEGR